LVFNLRNGRRRPPTRSLGIKRHDTAIGSFAYHDVAQIRRAVVTAGGLDLRMLGYFVISPAGVARRIAALPGAIQGAGLVVLWLLERSVTASGAGLLISRILLVLYRTPG
jgi:hypothetical protein